MNPIATARVDLHCHSTASEISKLGIQRSLGLPGVRDAAGGGLRARQAAGHGLRDDHRPRHDRRLPRDRRSPRRLHLRGADHLVPRASRRRSTCSATGSTPDDHEWLQAHNRDLEACAAYLHSHEIACSLAHPFYAVEAPLAPAPPPAAGASCSRSGRPATAPARASSTCRPRSTSRPTEVPASAAPTITPAWTSGGPSPRRRPRPRRKSFCSHVREGRAEARGDQGSAAKWAHAAMALATRALLLATPSPGGRRTPPATSPTRMRPEDRRAGDERGQRRASGARLAADLGPERRARAARRLPRRGRAGAARAATADRPTCRPTSFSHAEL